MPAPGSRSNRVAHESAEPAQVDGFWEHPAVYVALQEIIDRGRSRGRGHPKTGQDVEPAASTRCTVPATATWSVSDLKTGGAAVAELRGLMRDADRAIPQPKNHWALAVDQRAGPASASGA